MVGSILQLTNSGLAPVRSRVFPLVACCLRRLPFCPKSHDPDFPWPGRRGRDRIVFPSAGWPIWLSWTVRSVTTALFLAAWFGFACTAGAGSKREEKASLSFHSESADNSNPRTVFKQQIGGRERFFSRVADFTIRDIASFTPFRGDDGDLGLVCRLTPRATRRLGALSNVNQGTWMISQINGRVVDFLFIDRQIDDGTLVIWKGVTEADLVLLDETLPRTGGAGETGKKR